VGVVVGHAGGKLGRPGREVGATAAVDVQVDEPG
jgi:hypothetical protein